MRTDTQSPPPSPVVERYSRDAPLYERYWAPVLSNAVARLLEYVEWYAGGPPDRPLRVVDLGTGTGTLAAALLERWPQARVVASDGAAGMVEVAAERLSRHGDRVTTAVGLADRLPLADASIDLVASSFVLQLVPDRRAALAECRRLLRPDGIVAYVTWIDRGTADPFRPAEEFDEAVLELALEEPEIQADKIAGDVASATAAAAQLRRLGFRDVVAREDHLEYEWTLDSYCEYKLGYDEKTLMESLDVDQRARLERAARERLRRLPASAFTWRAPIVYAAARRP